MDEHAAAAMWTAAGVGTSAARTILRHLHSALGCRVQVPMPKVTKIGDDFVQPAFGVYFHEVEDGKKKEEVNYWTRDISDLIASDVARVINSNKDNESKLTYGYSSEVREGKLGCDVVIGSDHGQGACRCSAKLNLYSPKIRREKADVSFGSRILSFAHIQCKKDTTDILQQISQSTNDSVKKLLDGKLVAIRDKKGYVTCVCIPNNAKEERVVLVGNKKELQYNINDTTHHVEIKEAQFEAQGSHIIWDVIPQFTPFICGDLAFFFTILGRDGHSTCKCPYCTLTNSEWKSVNVSDGEKITLQLLQESLITKVHGVKAIPQWSMIEPEMYICPMLHIQMGLVNDSVRSLTKWINLNIERVSAEEELQREKVRQCNNEVIEFKNSQIEFEQTCLMAKQEASLEKAELITLIREEKKNKTQTLDVMEAWETRKMECAEIIREETKKIKDSKKPLTRKREELTKEKKVLDLMEKGRLLDAEGFEVEFDKILGIVAKIYKQSFHGGAFNGVCCIRFLENNKELMIRLKEMCERRRQMPRTHEQPCTYDEMINKLNSYSKLFECLDVVFAYLRILDPLEEELTISKKAIDNLRQLWTSLDLSVTPKAHILFTHVCEQQRRLNGLADKGEDFIELSHQEGIRLDYLTARIPKKYDSKQKTQLSIQWRASNPLVQEATQRAMANTSRKRKSNTPKLAVQRKHELKRIKLERRIGNMN